MQTSVKFAVVLVALMVPQIAGLLLVTWPPSTVALALSGSLGVTVGGVIVLLVRQVRRNRRFWSSSSWETVQDLPEEERIEWQLALLEQQERRLELRELRLARRMRVEQLARDEYVDLLEAHPEDGELEALIEADRRLIALIESESQRAFDRVRDNRYASEEGVDTELIFHDVREFIGRVANLYRPDTKDPLLETNLELVAKSVSSASLHLLVVVDGLPIDLKSYNAATMYRLVRRAASYYGTYQSFRPYIEHGFNALNAARLAFGINPATVGATWMAGKLAGQGARLVTETLLQQQALQLLHDFVRIIGFEAAMIYGGRFRHRDANWVYGAELVNLEVSRGGDLTGRDAALKELTGLALRHEFDRFRLLRHLGKRERVDTARAWPQVILTQEEREAIARRLADHGRSTQLQMDASPVAKWRRAVEEELGVLIPLPGGDRIVERSRSPLNRLSDALGKFTSRLRRPGRKEPGERERTRMPELGPPVVKARKRRTSRSAAETTDGGRGARQSETPPPPDAAQDVDRQQS